MSTFFTSKHDHPHINFVNETGDTVTISKIDIPSGFAFDSITKAQYDAGVNKSVPNNNSKTFGFVTTSTYNMFNKYGNSVKFTYTAGDGSVHTHSATIAGLRVYNAKLPSTVTVTIVFGSPGAPRPSKLKLQSNYINGFRYYLDTTGKVGMYFKVGSLGTVPKWTLVYDGTEIASYRSFLSTNTNCDQESGVLSFPMDGSFYGSTAPTYNNNPPGTTKTPVGASALNQYASWFVESGGSSIRVIYFQNTNWSASSSGVTRKPSKPNFQEFVYRSDRQYFNNGTAGNSKTSGMDTQGYSFIYQLGINETPSKNDIIEWELYESGRGSVNRILTQYKRFTIDLHRLGFNPSGLVYVRARILKIGRELTAAEMAASDSTSKSYGRSSDFTGWKALPTASIWMRPEKSSGSNGWVKLRAEQHYGKLYADCGWDTKFTMRLTGPGYTRDHPMVYPTDYVAAGLNANKTGVLGRHSFTSSLKYTHNNGNIASRSGTVLAGSPANAATWIRDVDANWGGKGLPAGTYTEGYQCCGKESGGNYTGRHHDECAPSAAITKAQQDFYWGQDCPTFTGTGFNERSGGNKWFGALDVIYIDDPAPKSNRSRYDGDGQDHRTSRNFTPFSSNVRSSYTEFQLTIDLPGSWVSADNTISIEVQNATGGWQPAIHMNGSSTYIHGYWCRWKISELPDAARNGNTWALRSSNLPGRVSKQDPESGRTSGQMHTYVHRKNFDDLEPFGKHQGNNVYYAYYQRVARLKCGGHLGLGYVHQAHDTQYCTPFSPSNTIQGAAVSGYKLRIRNVDTNQYSEPFTMTMTTTNNVRELAPFCEAYDDDDKDHNDSAG